MGETETAEARHATWTQVTRTLRLSHETERNHDLIYLRLEHGLRSTLHADHQTRLLYSGSRSDVADRSHHRQFWG
ncbi:protein of unknown function [Hyphomicrobium sp. MC1]|nr:protein of unknown function [Hyphomicrobium sp. MC1]